VSPTALLVAIALCAAPVDAGEHLLAGATAFREGRHAEALVEFRLAERLGDRDAGPYAGATLVKLGRFEEAVEAFGLGPWEGEDTLLSYFRALALRGAGLRLTASAALAAVGDRAGPRIGVEVQHLRAELGAALSAVPSREQVDALLLRGKALQEGGRLALAAAHCREAAALAERRPDRYRQQEAARIADELRATSPGRRGS
jgi:hypothetical protein